jgi:undecaprenyl-diphosphatase
MLTSLFVSAIILGIVEGLTEFLPISSTGHLILADRLLGLEGPESKLFDIVIQLGAILAVCWVYRDRLLRAAEGLLTQRTQQHFVANIVIAFLPAAIAGVFLYRFIKDVLFSPWVVAVSLIVGGVLILVIERVRPQPIVQDVDRISWMLGASVYDLYKNRAILSTDGAVLIAVGFVVAFIAALFVVRRLVDFVSRHGFGVFAWYRIVVGAIALVALAIAS